MEHPLCQNAALLLTENPMTLSKENTLKPMSENSINDLERTATLNEFST